MNNLASGFRKVWRWSEQQRQQQQQQGKQLHVMWETLMNSTSLKRNFSAIKLISNNEQLMNENKVLYEVQVPNNFLCFFSVSHFFNFFRYLCLLCRSATIVYTYAYSIITEYLWLHHLSHRCSNIEAIKKVCRPEEVETRM